MNRQRVSFTLGRRLRELREERGLSHVELIKQLNEKYSISVSRDSIMAYEIADGSRAKASKLPNMGMRVETLYCLADFYGVSLDYLLGKTEVFDFDVDIRGICEKTGLDERIAKYLIHLGASGDTQMVLDNRLFHTPDNSLMGIFNEIFQPEKIHGLLCICEKYTRFVQRVRRDIEETKYFLENPEEIEDLEIPDLYYSFRSYYEDKAEIFKGDLEAEFLSASRENKLSRIEGMDMFSAVFDEFHRCYSEKLELELQEILEMLSP